LVVSRCSQRKKISRWWYCILQG